MKNQTLNIIIQKILEDWNPIGVPEYIVDVEYLDYIPYLIQTAHNLEKTKKGLIYILRQMGYNNHCICNKKIQQDIDNIAQRIVKEYEKIISNSDDREGDS